MPPLPSPYAERKKGVPVDRVLPAEGRPGPPPPWPSGHRPTEAEAAAWARLWALPQAVAWADLGLAETVEVFTRAQVTAAADFDRGEPRAALLAVVRGMSTDLGLTAAGLARLRWQIGPATPAPETTPRTSATPRPRRMRATATDTP